MIPLFSFTARATTPSSGGDIPYADYNFNLTLLDAKSHSTLYAFGPTTDATKRNNISTKFGSDIYGPYWEWESNATCGGGFYIDLDKDLGGTYSLGIKFSFAQTNPGYRKILDFWNQGKDGGFYFYNGGKLNVYPYSTLSSIAIANNEVIDLIVTRSGSTDAFEVYMVVGGVAYKQLEVTDNDYEAVPIVIGGRSRIGFFFDDLMVSGEATSGGKVWAVKIWDVVVDTEDIIDELNPDTPTISVAAQNGIIKSGTAGQTVFAVTTENIADATTVSVLWFSAADGLIPTTAPTGITPSSKNIYSNKDTITMTATECAIPGSYYFKVTAGGAISSVCTLTVSAGDAISITYSATLGGTVSPSNENIAPLGNAIGSTAVASIGYTFDGWYETSDDTFTSLLTDNPLFIPDKVGCVNVAGSYKAHFLLNAIVCPMKMEDLVNGYDYNVVELAGLCWCTENLRATKYQDGTAIPFAKPYYHSLNPDSIQHRTTFGLLYTYESAFPDPIPATRTICPAGWRIPTSAEWLLLNGENMDDLRESDFWLQPNTNNNSSGFNLRGAGYFLSAADHYENLYGYTVFWSSDVSGSSTTICACTNYFCNIFELMNFKKSDAVSIRCIKDY
jgi:uncharacterized protein (TIGR02145 family)